MKKRCPDCKRRNCVATSVAFGLYYCFECDKGGPIEMLTH